MSITIRPARSSDRKSIRRIVRESGLPPLSLRWPRFMVAEENGRLIGVGQVKILGNGSHELAAIAVRPAYRRQGIASQIIESLLAREEGELYLLCRAELESFYGRFGFRQIEGEVLPRSMAQLSRLARSWAWLASRIGRQRITIIAMKREASGRTGGPVV